MARGGVTSQWDAGTYHRVSQPHVRWGAAVVDRLDLRGDEVVLDGGCGTGRVTALVLDRWPSVRVLGVDASPAMIAQATQELGRYGDRVSLVVGDLLDLGPALAGRGPGSGAGSGPSPGSGAGSGPGTSRGVDAVLSTATFHWIHDHDRLFANLAGVLAPGGPLVAQCGGAGNIAAVQAILADLGATTDDTYFATPEETVDRLHAAGFVDVSAWLQPEPTPFGSQGELETFLATVVLRVQLAALAPADRPGLVRAVAERLPRGVVDYVRLNMVARRG